MTNCTNIYGGEHLCEALYKVIQLGVSVTDYFDL